MSPAKLNGLEVLVGEKEEAEYEVNFEVEFDYSSDTSLQKVKSGDKDVIPAVDESNDVKIFLLNDEGKSFNVIKVIKDIRKQVIDEVPPKVKQNTDCDTKKKEDTFRCDQCGFCTSEERYLKSH